MNDVLIIGGGYGGLAAACKLAQRRHPPPVTLIDRRTTSDALPNLPDVASNRLRPEHCRCPLPALAKAHGFTFINDEVTGVDLANRVVAGKNDRYSYSYLVIAAGAQSFFHGQDQFRDASWVLDSVADAAALRDRLGRRDYDAVVVVGGGYTGVEIATHTHAGYREKGAETPRILLAEIQPAILANMPDAFRTYTEKNLDRCGIEICTETSVTRAENGTVELSTGETVANAVLIWTAGVRPAAFLEGLPVKKNAQQRLEVDTFLRVDETCYAVGDAACFDNDGGALRMAVQFSRAEGERAAENILRQIAAKPLRPYEPMDMGLVIPMANGRSVGEIFGKFVTGRLPTALHYFMSVYTARGLRTQLGLTGDLIRRRGR